MNGRLSQNNRIDERAPQEATRSIIPSAQTLRAQVAAQPYSSRLRFPTPSTSRQPPSEYDDSLPPNYPLPSPGFGDVSSLPESSAQAAARYAGDNPHPLSSSRPLDNVYADPSSPLTDPTSQRRIEHTNDTFGRTSGKSAVSETHDSQPSRRKTSPTEKAAFGYLASSWVQPSASAQNDEIAEYLNQGSVRSLRQDKIDALEKELNLSNASSPAAGTSDLNRDDASAADATGNPSLSAAPALHKSSHPTSLGVSGSSDTPDRTFGRPSHDHSQSTGPSGDVHPTNEEPRPSHSETTSSRDTDLSNNAAYGVGEAGGAQQFAALTRTLTPNQRLQQEELDRMSQQRGLVTPMSYSTGLPSPTSARAAQRASHHSNATVMATNTSLASSSTPKHDARFSRQTQATSSSEAARPTALYEGHESQSAFGHRPLFESRAGSHDSDDVLQDQYSPRMLEGPGPATSASVRVKTPMFGNTVDELPAGHRTSVVGGLMHDRAAAPYPSSGSMHGPTSNLNLQPVSAADNARYGTLYPQLERPAEPSQAHACPLQAVDQQYQPTRQHDTLSTQPHAHEANQGGSSRRVLDDRARTPHLPNLGDTYAGAPKFPPAPYSQYRNLRLPSRIARMHHTILPLLTYAHIPATLFLDYNVIFALTQIVLHPDNAQTGIRTAWWIALGIYGGCVLIWLLGVVVLYEGFWSFRRRWSVPEPLVMQIYLSNPAFTRTAIKDYSLYSLLYRARSSGSRRDALIETFWHYSQNWPTVLTLVPRGVISAILLVLYKPSGPALVTRGARDPVYFNQASGRFTQFAFILVTFQAAWAAWKLGVLLAANVGLIATLGFKSLVQQEEDRNAVANTEMAGFAGYSRRALMARNQLEDQSAVGGNGPMMDDGDVVQRASHRRWAWRWRAEDRIRAIMFDAGLLHQPLTTGWQYEQKEAYASGVEHANDGAFEPTLVQPVTKDQTARGDAHGQTDQSRDWFAGYIPTSQSQTGLALTSPDAVQPELWATAAHTTTPDAGGLTPAPPISQAFHVQHLASSPSDEGGDSSGASDPYSPAPLPIGRSPRSKEQLRSASSMSSRNDPAASLHASSISSLNRLAALTAAASGSPGLAQGVQGGHRSDDDMYTPSEGGINMFDGQPRMQPGADRTGNDVPGSSSATGPLQSSSDAALLSEWRGRKRPRSSPTLAYQPGLNPGGMVTETDQWLQGQLDEDAEEQNERRDASPSSKKPATFDNDGRIMHAFVPMPASFAMSKDGSLAGSAEHGTSDTKHGSWTAAAPNPELFSGKPASSPATPSQRKSAEAQNTSSTSLGSMIKGGRPGTHSRSRSSGHGHEMSSEDGISLEAVEAKKQGRNPLLGRTTNKSSSESRRSGSSSRPEGESWITSLFGSTRAALRKASTSGQSSSPSVGDAPTMRRSGSDPRSEAESGGDHDGLPTVITTSASTSLPTADSGSVQQHDGASADQAGALQSMPPESSLLLAPVGGGHRSPSPAHSSKSNVSAETDDSEEGRLWASFPTQSRRHPPGFIALDLEQRTLSERRMAAAAAHQNKPPAPTLPGSTLNLSPLMHPSVLAAVGNAAPTSLPAMLGGVGQLSVSPSEGGLHAIREESWTSSLDSRSQGATGSTRSRGTASAVTASPVDAEFPLEQIEEVAVPHHSSHGAGRR